MGRMAPRMHERLGIQKQVCAEGVGDYQSAILPVVCGQIFGNDGNLLKERDASEFAYGLSAGDLIAPTQQRLAQPRTQAATMARKIVN